MQTRNHGSTVASIWRPRTSSFGQACPLAITWSMQHMRRDISLGLVTREITRLSTTQTGEPSISFLRPLGTGQCSSRHYSTAFGDPHMANRWAKGRSSVVAATLLVVSCVNQDTTTAQETCVESALRDESPGLTLHACSLEDTLQLGESLKVYYIIRNNGRPVTFANNPYWMSIRLTDSSGRDLPLRAPQQEEPTLGRSVYVTLPRHGFVGGVINTSCAEEPFGERTEGATPCNWSITVSREGNYTVMAAYESVPPPGQRDSLRTPRLQAKPFRVTVKSRLADAR